MWIELSVYVEKSAKNLLVNVWRLNSKMAAPVKKKPKLGDGNDSKFQGIFAYIVPTKIQKKRLEIIHNCAKSLNLTVLDQFR